MNDQSSRILIAGADETVVGLEQPIANAGFRTRCAGDAQRVRRLLDREHFDGLILDQQIPGGNGLELCSALRARGVGTAIFMLTGRDCEKQRVQCLEMGADDCVGKPCHPDEVVARLRAILRRIRRPVGAPELADRPVQFGPFQLDLSHRLLKKGDSTVPLTTGDFALLSALVRNPGQPMSRDQLKAVISKREYTADDRSVDVRIARLRRLLEGDTTSPRYLQTVWGFGYVMVPGN